MDPPLALVTPMAAPAPVFWIRPWLMTPAPAPETFTVWSAALLVMLPALVRTSPGPETL